MTEFFQVLLLAVAAYLMAGSLFAAVFHWRGLHAVDAGSHDAGPGFRLLVTPGIIALWPLLALRWRRLARGRVFLGEQDSPVSQKTLQSTHRLVWQLLAVLLPLLLGLILWLRPREVRTPLPDSLHPVSRQTLR